MGRIVILEGPDGGGKTTLARELEEKYFFRYKHDGPPPLGRDNIAYYLEVLWEALEHPQDTVFDRLWLGERIYGPVARGIDTIGDEGQRLFARIHNAYSIHHILCLPPIDVVKENYKKKIKEPDDYLKSEEKLHKVFERYCRWAYNYTTLRQHFDYRKDGAVYLLPGLNKDCLPRGTVGSTKAKYLFIGDVPNHPYIDIPFHALNGSSGYFNQALTFAGIKEEDLAISSAFSPDGKVHDLGLIFGSLPRLDKIFLMGNKAADWFYHQSDGGSGISIRIYRIPHPSYLKRFKGNNPLTLAEAIRTVIND